MFLRKFVATVAAAAAIATGTGTVASAAAPDWYKDPAGDYKRFHTRVSAPRASIDIRATKYVMDAREGDEFGTSVKVRIKRTLWDSKRFKQRLTVTLSGIDGKPQRFVTGIGLPVTMAGTHLACPGSSSGVSGEVFEAFIPDSCLKGTGMVYGIDAKMSLVGKRGRVYATDTGSHADR